MRTLAEIIARVDAAQPVTAEEAHALLRGVERRCRGALPAEAREHVTRLVREGALEQARALDTTARTPCGQDVTALMLLAPLDGAEYEVPCPRCQTVIRYTAPRIVIAG